MFDLKQERERRRQRRNHLNNICEMVDKMDTSRTKRDTRAISFKRSTSHTGLNNKYVTRVQKVETKETEDSRRGRMRSVSPAKVLS